MTTEKQCEILVEELWRVIYRFADEFDLPQIVAIGCVRTVEHELLLNLFAEETESDSDS